MGDKLLRLYHALPAPMRSVAASLRGQRLRSWRYGPETEGLVEEALEREHWSPERWKRWQEARLAFVLHRAATKVPYYRDQWAERRRGGDQSSWEYLENWPLLNKEPLREQPTRFVADDCDSRRMYHEHTSGTTGKPLDLWWSRETVRLWFALHEARTRYWNKVSRHDHWAILGGQPVVPANAQRPPFWVWNAPLNQLYLSANHISRRNAPAYVDALARHHVTHLVAYSSSVSVLAREASELGLPAPGLKVIITNAEPLFPWQREAMRQGLGCEVQETYGMAEIVMAASECAAGQLHMWPEVGWLEVLDDTKDVALAAGSSGRFVCTGLLNADMPLIRYTVGDRGRLAPEPTTCQCGRTLPAIAGIEGRNNDLLITRDGRRVFWLNPVFYGIPVSEAQIIQETLDQVRVRYVPTPDFTLQSGRTITERLQSRMGDVKVTLERIDQAPRGANGKLQAVVCNLSAEEREQALASV